MLAKTDDERIWMLNPRLLVKGDIIVKARLMSKYDSLLGRPLSDWIITDSNGNDPLFLPIEYPTPESLDTAKSDFIKVYPKVLAADNIALFFSTEQDTDVLAVFSGKDVKIPHGWYPPCR